MPFACRVPAFTLNHDNTWKTFHIMKMVNESETTVETDKPKEPLADEEHTRCGRSDTMYSSYEMTRMRSNYENATEDHQRALSRAESRRSHGPPKGLRRTTSPIYDFWTHHISIVVAHDPRDHLALERTFLSYLKTSQAFALLSVLISQMFLLQHRKNPDPVFGYHAVGKPLAVVANCFAIFYMLLGFYRWYRLQQSLVRIKALAGGFEVSLLLFGTGLLILTLFVLSVAIAIRRHE